MQLVEGPSEIMRFVQKRRACSSNAESELHIRLGVWVGGQGKGDALISHTGLPWGAGERGTTVFGQREDHGSRGTLVISVMRRRPMYSVRAPPTGPGNTGSPS